jgi:hypothetical protein
MFAPSHTSSIPAFTNSPDQNMLRETVPDKEQRDGPGQGRSQDGVFFIVRGANHTNLYKNLIKI